MNDAMRYRLELGDEARERARVEDLEDLRDLNEAIARNKGNREQLGSRSKKSSASAETGFGWVNERVGIGGTPGSLTENTSKNRARA